MKTKRKKYLLLFIPLIILNIISLLNMISAKAISINYNNYFIKQLIWFSFGYLIIFLINKIKINTLFKYSKYLYIFSCLLLVWVLIFGNTINGSKCWISILGFSFQPSELTKLTLTLYVATIINNSKFKNVHDQIKIILKLLIIILIPSILVFLEPDTGAILNYLIIFTIALVFLKLPKGFYISIASLVTILGGTFFIMYFFFQDILIKIIGTTFFYRMDRLINFAKGNSYQLEQALVNIGMAPIIKFNFNILLYIPEAPTDFFFAFATGNYGIILAFTILLLLLLINIFLISNISKLKNKAYKFLSCAYLTMLLFNEIYNIGMNIGLLPIMGIPLPFLSYGGSSIIINYLFLGIMIKIFQEKSHL